LNMSKFNQGAYMIKLNGAQRYKLIRVIKQ
jgi:hypothetical protein